MYDAILEILHGVWKNGFSLTALGTAVFVLLKQRKVKKRLRRYIPWLLEDDSEVKAYIHNQHLIMERLGIEWNGPEASKTVTATNSKISYKFSWGVKIMKEYLKKLGRTKFQAFLILTISNIAMLVLFFTGSLNLEGDLQNYLPAINIGAQLIGSGIYIWVEGKIDTARAGKEQADDDFTTPIEPRV